MDRLLLSVVVLCALGCPAQRVKSPTPPASAPASQATTPPLQSEEEIGLLSARLVVLSDEVACVYGGWTCQSGEQSALLRCTTKVRSEAEDRCAFLSDAQLSRDGQHLWLSCEGKDGAPYIVRSSDVAQSFSLSEPLAPAGQLVAWSFISSKSGTAVIAAAGPEAEAKSLAYIERSTSDGGLTWKTLFEVPIAAAASFNPAQEVGARPASKPSQSFSLQTFEGPDGGPAYRLQDSKGTSLLSVAWQDIPMKCAPSAPLPIDDSFPEVVPGYVP